MSVKHSATLRVDPNTSPTVILVKICQGLSSQLKMKSKRENSLGLKNFLEVISESSRNLVQFATAILVLWGGVKPTPPGLFLIAFIRLKP